VMVALGLLAMISAYFLIPALQMRIGAVIHEINF
jgi:hypothetical protein